MKPTEFRNQFQYNYLLLYHKRFEGKNGGASHAGAQTALAHGGVFLAADVGTTS